MKSIFKSEYHRLFIGGLILTLIAAWFSLGYNQPDEHFQILEFANYKLGYSPAKDLPWEFAAKIRPGLQPFIAYCFISACHFVSITDPFVITFLIRLFVGLLAWYIVCKLILLLLPSFSTEKGKRVFMLLSLFLWFVPYFNIRFSSENASALSFMWIVYLLLKPQEAIKQERISFLTIGLLLSLSFFFRFQMAFAIAGLFAWLLCIRKASWQNWLLMSLTAIPTLALCVYLDRWVYGIWVCTPYNYYYANIVQHIAANFGTFPWWNYFLMFFLIVVPPLSLVLLIFFFVGEYKKWKHIFSFIMIPFLIGHFIVGHKEMRFLIPMWFAFIYLTAIGIDFCISKYKTNRAYNIGFKFLAVLNCILLAYRILDPAQEAIPCFKFVQSYFKQKPIRILCVDEPLYNLVGLNANFYKPGNVQEIVLKNEAELEAYVEADKDDTIIVFQRKILLDKKLNDSYRNERIYTPYPEWLLKYDINHWQERSNIWSIYLLYKRQS
jgi:phosphatidylinositol glycan class B